ncbi:MAG TPA: hypothetical protein VHG35_08725 [Gemmatimonadales bacterium]|nr:hypothetical protein [Gemmatimonadales bacterium]
MSAEAIERLEVYFARRDTRQGVLARQALGRPAPGDGALAARLRGELSAGLRPDGTVSGGAVPTIWRVHELLDLGEPGNSPAVARALAWLLELQDGPGTYHDDCDRVRHARRLCHHFLAGFFAPAPPAQRLAPVTLPTGKVFRVEPAARFAISCLGLRAALRAGLGGRPPIERHLQSLARISEQWTEWNGYFAPDLMVAGLHALALGGPAYGDIVRRLVGLLVAHQRIEGEWSGADLFQVIDALLAAGTPDAQVTVRRAATALTARQRNDGTFGTTAQEERALVALRALLWASRSPA